jgi:hypothetical protein
MSGRIDLIRIGTYDTARPRLRRHHKIKEPYNVLLLIHDN